VAVGSLPSFDSTSTERCLVVLLVFDDFLDGAVRERRSAQVLRSESR
jgi:hypothetical protein